MYTVTCLSPLNYHPYANDHHCPLNKSIVEEKLANMDEKSLLQEHKILLKQLKVSYRNSREIQLFYNVYQAHYNSLSKDKDWDILTGEMKQPEMDPNHSSNQDEETNLLPLGPKPTLLITNKESKKLK